MMADLVNQYVADDMLQRLFVLGPVIQDRPTVEPNQIRQPGNVLIAAKRQAYALKQAEQIELAFRVHFLKHLLGRKIIDADDHALAQLAKGFWQAPENLVRHGFHLGKRGGFRGLPHLALFSPGSRSCTPLLWRKMRPQLTSARQSETLRNELTMGVSMRVITVAVLVALAGGLLQSAAGANAQSAPQGTRTAEPARFVPTDVSAQRHVRRPPTRLRVYRYYEPGFDGVYPRYYPGRNAVRECTANYVQEYRLSGTVIVPRMSCFWRPG